MVLLRIVLIVERDLDRAQLAQIAEVQRRQDALRVLRTVHVSNSRIWRFDDIRINEVAEGHTKSQTGGFCS